MKHLVSIALALIFMVDVAPPAHAGFWNYGCKGTFEDDALIFDRETIVLVPKALGDGDIKGLMKGSISAFNAADVNSGFLPVMNFTSELFADQKIVLTEKSSKMVSKREGHVGTRQKTTITYRKVYHYERLGWDPKPEGDVAMDCIEYELTAP